MSSEKKTVDLRSDTVTQPSPEMRLAMANARVGDDVLGEDPTVNELEMYTADLFQREASLFVPSGTMANQIAIRVYARPGEEILTMNDCHVFFYEAGSAAGLSGVQLFPIPSQNGVFAVQDFQSRIRRDDVHFPRTRLFWIENTHNRGGGRIVSFDLMTGLKAMSEQAGIPIHVDGARICNAAVATGISLAKWAAACNSLSVCLSKGLGAPVGSMIIGHRDFIRECRRARKALGGGMRQAGIIAAAGLYALKNNMQRLAEDHRLAALLAHHLREIPQLTIPFEPQTNIVMIDVNETPEYDASDIQVKLEAGGVRMFAIGPRRLRAVTHLDVSESDITVTVNVFHSIFGH